ncbi:hypothetical protein RB195_010364 [Necator americanus]
MARAALGVGLLIFTGLLNVCFEESIRQSCFHVNSTQRIEECFDQRQAIFLGIVFSILRIITYKIEVILVSRRPRCLAKQASPGHHIGFALGLPYVIRKLLLSTLLQPSPFLNGSAFMLSCVVFYPYARDLFTLCKLVLYGIQRRFYNTNHDFIFTAIALYIYFSVLTIEFFDVSSGLYCSQRFLGLPLIFPNINFPLLLYVAHNSVIAHHKRMPLIVYEVNEEDCFVQLHRLRCLCQKDCPDL